MSANSKRRFRVVDGPIRVREAADVYTRVIGELNVGDVVLVDIESRRENDGYIWWHHDFGWSAERTVDGRYVLMQPAEDENAFVPR